MGRSIAPAKRGATLTIHGAARYFIRALPRPRCALPRLWRRVHALRLAALRVL